MTLRDRIVRLLEGPPAAKPKTFPGKVLGSDVDYFGKRDQGKRIEYRRMYEQGGFISEAIDCYPLTMLTAGYRIEGDRVEEAEQFLDDIDFETTAWKTIVDALVVEIGLAEIQPGLSVPGEVAKVPIAKVDHRFPETFEEKRDDFGKLLGYKQRIASDLGKRAEVDVTPEQMFRLDLGLPLIARAYDDIMRDVKVAEGTAKTIERIGFPRHLVTVGEPGETIPQTVIDAVGVQFENLKPQHDLVQGADVKITTIDQQGVTNTKIYSEWSIQRATAALGVPEEMLGLGRGVLTGEIRSKQFYDKIGTLQQRFARQWNTQIMDRWAGVPGKTWIVFNDVSPVDEALTADLIQKLMTGTIDQWQIVTPEWCRKRLGISEEEFAKWREVQDAKDAEQAKIDAKLYPQLQPGFPPKDPTKAPPVPPKEEK